ncbi:MAG TPA: DUF4139 domain-containing protein [Candidatus Kapabacteria bacterium]|nr:DUF4139 domain-containing protein [Candidatus Kapabacteria bacterium]
MKKLIVFLMTIITLNAQENSNYLTIYNGGFSVVKNNTEFKLNKGINRLTFKDFSDQVEISSINLDIQGKVLEKSFINSTNDINSILKQYIGKNISLLSKDGNIFGTVLSANNTLIVKTNDGKFAFVNNIDRYSIIVDDMLLDLDKKKEYTFVVESESNTKVPAQISYLTNGLGWKTEYTAYIDSDSKKMNLEGWVNVINNSGIDYTNSNIKFIAGNIEKNQDGGNYQEQRTFTSALMMKSARDMSNIEAKSFSDLYTYSYPSTITLLKGEFKQLPLIAKQNISIQNKYNFYSFDYNNNETNLNIIVEIKNDSKNGLGIPLPAGNIKIFKQDGKSYELIGENAIEHTAKDETLRIKTGSAFDLLGKSETIESTQISDRVIEQTREITLKNRKDEDVTIDVLANLGRAYEVLSSDENYNKENANQIKFTVKVSKNSEKKFKFKYRLKW